MHFRIPAIFCYAITTGPQVLNEPACYFARRRRDTKDVATRAGGAFVHYAYPTTLGRAVETSEAKTELFISHR